MRKLFLILFEKSHFNTGIKITPFSLSHIIWILIIACAITFLVLFVRNRSIETREKVLNYLAIALVISYISDFFMHDFVYGGLNMDKLPFHLCTVLCPIVVFAQFNKKLERFLEPITALAIVGPLMYITYPASVGSGEPWCYQAVQTMFFHGVELAWGLMNVFSGKVVLNIKNVWKSAVGLGIIALWAKFGNVIYAEYNWFFLEKDAFYLGLVENGIIPKWSLMLITPTAIFLIVLAIYGIYYAVKYYLNKAVNKKA